MQRTQVIANYNTEFVIFYSRNNTLVKSRIAEKFGKILLECGIRAHIMKSPNKKLHFRIRGVINTNLFGITVKLKIFTSGDLLIGASEDYPLTNSKIERCKKKSLTLGLDSFL
jgi:hypothetical protein